MATKKQTKRRATSKKRNIFDPLSLYYAAGTAQDLGSKFMPSQKEVNRFVWGGKNPSNEQGSYVLHVQYRYEGDTAWQHAGGREVRFTGSLADAVVEARKVMQQMTPNLRPGQELRVKVMSSGGYDDLAIVKQNPEDIEFLNNRAPYLSQGHVEFTPDGIERFVRGGYVYRAFSNTPVFPDGYRVGSIEGSASEMIPEYASNPAKFERCVKGVQAKGGANEYAVCTAAGLRNPEWDLYEPVPKGFHGIVYRSGRMVAKSPFFTSKHDAQLWADKYLRQLRMSDKVAGYKGPYKAVARKNPLDSSDELYTSFHGAPPTETLLIRESEHVHGNLAGLGDLTEIVVRLTGGSKAGGVTTLTAPNPSSASDSKIVRVASNEAANQMYLVGGDQRIDVVKLGFRDSFDVTHDGETFEATELKDLMVIGEIQKLTYQTRKEADDFKLIDYYHRLGEDTQVRPFLLYDTMNEKMRIAGGQYHIHDVGVVN